MSEMEKRIADYDEMRKSSRKLLMADIEHARATFSAKGLTSRYLGGVAEGAKDVYEVAKVHTVDHRGVIAVVLGALAVWFGREPLLAAMAEEIDAIDLDAQGSAVQPTETQTPPEDTSSGDIDDN